MNISELQLHQQLIRVTVDPTHLVVEDCAFLRTIIKMFTLNMIMKTATNTILLPSLDLNYFAAFLLGSFRFFI